MYHKMIGSKSCDKGQYGKFDAHLTYFIRTEKGIDLKFLHQFNLFSIKFNQNFISFFFYFQWTTLYVIEFSNPHFIANEMTIPCPIYKSDIY